MDSGTNLVSFVLRFVSEQTVEETNADTIRPVRATWHGVIRHVQTSEERHFTRWAEAVSFISRYVTVEDDAIDSGEESKPVTGL